MAADEAPPRLDEIEGWPLPEERSDWFGAGEAEAVLAESYASGRMHHAWLIGGPKGIGKATLAYRLARFVLTHPDPAEAEGMPSLAVSPDGRVSRLIAARAHPNVLTLQRPWDEKGKRFKTLLTVDEVRRIQRFFGQTPGEGRWRICVVDSADDFNPNAANALLKMLEEPPADSLFLILSHAPGRLLPTLRSRCRRLDLAPLPAEVIAGVLRQEGRAGLTEEDRHLVAELASGSLRRAIQLTESDGVRVYRAFQAAAARLPQLDMAAIHMLGDAVSGRGEGDAFDGFLDAAREWLARRVRHLPEPAGGSLAPAAARAPLARWAEVWEKLAETADQADELNLDRKQVVLSFFMTLARATRM